MISIKEIAAKLGVSIATVSSVLNGKEKERRINAALADKIKRFALESGYHPNQVAVSLRTGKSRIIGLIVDNISGAFFASLANTIEKELEKYGYTVLYCSTGNNESKVETLIRILFQHNVDGYLVIPAAGMEEQLSELTSRKRPVVLMDSYFPDTKLPYVLVNNYEGTAAGIKHLIKAGCRNIAFVCNDISLVQMAERRRGFVETMISAKMQVGEDSILATPYMGEKGQVVRSIAAYLKKKRPDAVMFAANYLGVYGLEAIKKLGWTIPSDIGVVCFDDHELFQINTPEITAVKQPVEDIAQLAVKILMGEMGIEKKVTEQQVEIMGKLIRRKSV
ncbi:LacI family DNA-binding transcriptional regulator [Flavihumibacter solisilvae]|uniref:HTH lacI-type domain-containing protein n=1 Tax=Flavihumibacter solisilvae TaxID=1349421 RepID=A0A0C1L9S1_9BACT|nr:LacI family DNA-binding transcriptional regulator [Flavihumibacter solisilvae]KIC96281.1 hypothetical protein OI18_00500 [Flavihumibacter solisilvae]